MMISNSLNLTFVFYRTLKLETSVFYEVVPPVVAKRPERQQSEEKTLKVTS